MKILHIISSGGMYGAEAVILTISRTLNAGAHRSVLGVFSNSAQPNLQLHNAALEQGIESHLIPCEGQLDRSVPASIARLARQTGADLIHAHGYKADVYVYLASRSRTIPVVSTCHTWYDNNLLVRAYGAVDRFVLRRYAAVVAVSDQVRQRLLDSGVPASRIRQIRNGIDLRPFAGDRPPAGDRPLVVGLVGRLEREKGVDLFLHAAAEVLRELPAIQFVIAGDGPDRTALETLRNELGITANVRFLGRTDDMPALYRSLDLMVSSSRQEGLPIAILEGMASRLPLVATSVGAVPTVVHHEQTGILVPPEDVPALSSAILDLLRDPAKRQQLGLAANQLIADQFSAARMTSDYLELYGEVLA